MKSVSNLRPGCIVILNVDEVAGSNIPEFIVVGSEPTVTRPANQVSFNMVLKKNGRDEYLVSSRTKTLNFDQDNILDVYAVLQPGQDLMNIEDVQDDFEGHYGELVAAFDKAKNKQDWYVDEFNVDTTAPEENLAVDVVMNETEVFVPDTEAFEPDTEAVHQPNIRRFYVVIDADDDAAECLECALEELIGDGDINEYSVTELE
jgi:hypothetical protein